MSRWYRAYAGTVTDPKLGEVALVAGCSRSVAIAVWHCILESAAEVNDSGRFDATARRISVVLSEQPAVIESVMAELEALGMIGGATVTAWKRRQYESDTSTERSRRLRERRRAAAAPYEDVAATECNGDATLHRRCATPPETKTETETENKNTPPYGGESVAEAADRPDPVPPCPYADIAEVYGTVCIGMPAVRVMTDGRRAAMRARWREDPDRRSLAWWREYFGRAAAAPFLNGANDRGWVADFDWLLKPANLAKVCEGKYDARARSHSPRTVQNIHNLREYLE